jgi:hypothetical protein
VLTRVPAAYNVTVLTGDIRNGGTSAKVFLTLHGEKSAARMPLIGQKFSRSGSATFSLTVRRIGSCFLVLSQYHFLFGFIRCQADCVCPSKVPRIGRLQKITVEHDNSGIAPGWFLERVRCVCVCVCACVRVCVCVCSLSLSLSLSLSQRALRAHSHR